MPKKSRTNDRKNKKIIRKWSQKGAKIHQKTFKKSITSILSIWEIGDRNFGPWMRQTASFRSARELPVPRRGLPRRAGAGAAMNKSFHYLFTEIFLRHCLVTEGSHMAPLGFLLGSFGLWWAPCWLTIGPGVSK